MNHQEELEKHEAIQRPVLWSVCSLSSSPTPKNWYLHNCRWCAASRRTEELALHSNRIYQCKSWVAQHHEEHWGLGWSMAVIPYPHEEYAHGQRLSLPIYDPILKELEGPTKDRSAYWRRFSKVDIITSYHYIIDGDTYKRHRMPHEYNNIIHKSTIRLRMKHKQKLKRHPPC